MKSKIEFCLKTLENKPEIVALIETWMTLDDDIVKLILRDYRKNASRPRKLAKRHSGGVNFIIREGVYYIPMNNHFYMLDHFNKIPPKRRESILCDL